MCKSRGKTYPQSSMYAKYAGNPRRWTFRPATAQPYRRAQMCANHEGKHTLRAQCMQNMQEIPGGGFSGQLPHSHIGELRCVQNTRENILQSSMYAKYAGNPRWRIFRPATAQPYRRAQCMHNTQEIPGAVLSGQLPHSRIA